MGEVMRPYSATQHARPFAHIEDDHPQERGVQLGKGRGTYSGPDALSRSLQRWRWRGCKPVSTTRSWAKARQARSLLDLSRRLRQPFSALQSRGPDTNDYSLANASVS